MGKEYFKGKRILKAPVHFIDEASRSIEEIKKRHNIISMFKSYGVELRPTGKAGQYMGLCPFHDDKEPSLSVNEKDGVFYCFGCGVKGDVINLVMMKDGLTIREAIKKLSEEKDINSRQQSQNENLTDNDLKLELSDIEPSENFSEEEISLTVIAEHYHKELYQHEEALDYLKRRGITNPEIISRFKIGYSDGKSLLKKLSKNQVGFLIEREIFRKNGQEAFANSLVFPIFDDNGEVVHFYARNIDDNAKVKHLYLSGSHKSVFNRKVVKAYNDRLILTESIIDALSLIQLGINNVWSCYGVQSFTDEMLSILKENRVKEVVIAFDNDEAGKRGAEKLREKLVENDFGVRIIFPPNKKDWNEELVSGITVDMIKELIEKAEVFTLQKAESLAFKVSFENGVYVFLIEGITYRLGGIKDIFSPNLKVKIRVEREDKYHRDYIDLYSYRTRQSFASVASSKVNVNAVKVEKDLDKILDYFEEEREKKTKAFEDKQELTEEEKEMGLKFLKSPDIFKEIIEDITTIGYVGEDLNKLLLYLCATSRLTENPVSVLIISQSATGKSYLVDIIKKLIPEEEVITIHSLSDQALNYVKDLIGKFLAFGEAIFNPEVERQIREMLSSKELTRMVVDKDDRTGELIGKIISKEVNVACVMSTTSSNVHPENASRFFIVNVDESVMQTKRIQEKQKEKYSVSRYYERKEKIPEIIKKHHAAQRMLKEVNVVLPEVMRELIKFPYKSLRTRRDHERFIDLIGTICFLRQYQKERKEFRDGREYVECDEIDYEVARQIMINGSLTSTLSEIPESTIRLYEGVRKMVKEIGEEEGLKPEEVTFSQRDVREWTGFGQSWVKQNLRLLVEYEYINRVRGGVVKGSRGFYKLKADEDMVSIDFSMLPEVERIKEALGGSEKEN